MKFGDDEQCSNSQRKKYKIGVEQTWTSSIYRVDVTMEVTIVKETVWPFLLKNWLGIFFRSGSVFVLLINVKTSRKLQFSPIS